MESIIKNEVVDLINLYLNEKDVFKKVPIFAKLSRYIGYWDKAGRYYLHPEFRTESSELIREPSRAWPKSIYTHTKSSKYIKQLMKKISE